jgi:hypothetical protein
MKRLYLTVEGQTEQEFAVSLLQPHLAAFDVFVWKPRLTGPHGRRGGRIPQGGMFHTFVHAFNDMRRWLREDQSSDARFSMMVDLYELPRDFPGYDAAMALADPYAQTRQLEQALAVQMNDARFIPYLQVHEFEALILSDPSRIAYLIEGRDREIHSLTQECQAIGNPELINHSQHGHPKGRIRKYVPEYDENVHGPLLAEDIGLQNLRAKCRHFGEWLARLESLDQ